MAKETISSKFKHIMSECNPISTGPPSRYQLKTKEESIGNIKRMIFGEKNPNKINKTILLVGETGAGKSTLVNALVNYAMGVEFEDNIWFEIVEDEKRSQSESQTSDVIVYEIFGFEDKTLPYSLTIIDTPGYNNTRGIEHDSIISQRLFDLFRSEEGVREINGVGLVMRASDCRLNDRLKYIFDSVVSLFGKDLEEKIVTLITNSNGLLPKNALKALETTNIKCAKHENHKPVHFLFDNCQDEDRTSDTEADLQNAWERVLKGMQQFTTFVKDSSAQTLGKTVDVLNSRIGLLSCIHNLHDKISFIELKQNEIKQFRDRLNDKVFSGDEKLFVEVDEPYKCKDPIVDGKWESAVCCTICEETCHYLCTLAQSPKDCKMMNNGCCITCKCPVSNHVKEKWRYVNKIRRVRKTIEELTEKYNIKDNDKMFLALKSEIESCDNEKNLLLDEAYQLIVQLEQISLDADSTYVHLDFLIERMKEKGDAEKVQKLKKMKSRVDERMVTET